MTQFQVRSRIGRDGVLSLSLPIGSADADREVIVTVAPAENGDSIKKPDSDTWTRFIDATAGRWQGGTFDREPEGDFEERSSLQ